MIFQPCPPKRPSQLRSGGTVLTAAAGHGRVGVLGGFDIFNFPPLARDDLGQRPNLPSSCSSYGGGGGGFSSPLRPSYSLIFLLGPPSALSRSRVLPLFRFVRRRSVSCSVPYGTVGTLRTAPSPASPASHSSGGVTLLAPMPGWASKSSLFFFPSSVE